MNDTLYIIFLITVSVLAAQAINLSYKLGSVKMQGTFSSPPLMCTAASLFIGAIYLVMALAFDGGISFPNRMSIFYALGLGLSYSFAASLYLIALACGPYTITSILLNMSSFMPILYSRLFLGEKISLFQLIGLTVIISACVVLTISRSRGAHNAKASLRWMVYVLLMFFSNSFISFSIRVNTRLAPETPTNSFFFLAYVFAAVICFILFLFSGGIKKKTSAKPLILPAACVAASLAIQLTPTAILPRFLSSALQYPIEKGLSIIVGVITGIAFFKEKIGKVGYICVAAIIGALCLLGIS